MVNWVLTLEQAADEQSVARWFGISRKSFYKWKRRHAAHGDAGLCDRPRTPRRSLCARERQRARAEDHRGGFGPGDLPPGTSPVGPTEGSDLNEAAYLVVRERSQE